MTGKILQIGGGACGICLYFEARQVQQKAGEVGERNWILWQGLYAAHNEQLTQI